MCRGFQSCGTIDADGMGCWTYDPFWGFPFSRSAPAEKLALKFLPVSILLLFHKNLIEVMIQITLEIFVK